MNSRSLWLISTATTGEAEEAVAALLEGVFDRSPSIYADVENKTSTVTVYVRKPLNAQQRLALDQGLTRITECGLSVGSGRILSQRVKRQDWSESWKKYFKTIEIGTALLIKASWSKRRPRRKQAVVVLDPGLSFGTGQHPTTWFCLHQLATARLRRKAQSFLDMGTGSGILAIAAAKLGYEPVDAFDFDPVAVRIARANARRNQVEHAVSINQRDLTKLPRSSLRKYDLVCANLTDDLLIGQADKILNRLLPGGRLVLAGILADQFAVVKRAFEARGLKLVASRREREWQCGAFEFTRKARNP